MHERLPSTTVDATSVAATSCREISSLDDRGNILPDWSFERLARQIWPRKTAAHLHHILGSAERTCRAWASGSAMLPARALVALLRSDHGDRVLSHIMDGCNVPWWRKHLRDEFLGGIFDAQLAGRPEQFELKLD